MKKLIIIIFLLFAQTYLFSQKFADNKYYLIDSVDFSSLTKEDKILLMDGLKSYHSAKNDLEKVNSLRLICEKMMDDIWIKYQYFLLDLIHKSLRKKQNPKIAYELQIALAESYNNIGYSYDMKSNVEKALEFYHKSLFIQKKLNYLKGLSNSYSNIAVILHQQGKITKALNYHQNSLKIREKIDYKKGISDPGFAIADLEKASIIFFSSSTAFDGNTAPS